MDEKLWGEKEDVERKEEEVMPGDVVSKEVRFVFTRKTKSARRPYREFTNSIRHVQKSPIEEFWYFRQED